MGKRSKFLSTLCRSIANTYERKGLGAIVPWWLLLGAGLGALVATYMPAAYWSNEKWDVATTVFAGFLAFNGLLLAFGWAAFSKIYEILNTRLFAEFLKRNSLMEDHLFFVEAIHAILVLSAVASGIALFTVLIELPLLADRIIMGAVIGISLWSLVKALSAVRMVNDLIWESAHMEAEDGTHLRTVK